MAVKMQQLPQRTVWTTVSYIQRPAYSEFFGMVEGKTFAHARIVTVQY